MQIYVGNLPKGTRASEIRKLIKDSVKASVFSRLYDKALNLGRLDAGVDVNIFSTSNHKGKYRYAQITIESNRLAPLALDCLKNQSVRGAEISIRKYVERNQNNDRRNRNWRKMPWNDKSRRISDRRQNGHDIA